MMIVVVIMLVTPGCMDMMVLPLSVIVKVRPGTTVGVVTVIVLVKPGCMDVRMLT
jgi:hypothetical protein